MPAIFSITAIQLGFLAQRQPKTIHKLMDGAPIKLNLQNRLKTGFGLGDVVYRLLLYTVSEV